ncbi:MAG: hypothetical protein AB2598_16140 [Candidatus Thiodiazotropha sp.]
MKRLTFSLLSSGLALMTSMQAPAAIEQALQEGTPNTSLNPFDSAAVMTTGTPLRLAGETKTKIKVKEKTKTRTVDEDGNVTKTKIKKKTTTTTSSSDDADDGSNQSSSAGGYIGDSKEGE